MDTITLSYVMAASNIIVAIVMYYTWYSNKNIEGVFYWFIAWVFTVIAFSSALFKPWIGNYSVPINNTLAYVGVLCILEGVIRYKKISVSKDRKQVFIGVILYFLVVSFINKDNPSNRYIFNDLIAASLFIAITITLLVNNNKKSMKLYIVPACASLGYVIAFVFRFISSINGTILGSSGTHASIILIYFIGIIWSFSWGLSILMILQNTYSEKMMKMAHYDNMTDLLNRRSFDKHLEEKINTFNPQRDVYYLTLIDLDQFKKINDDFGHAVGDEVIVETANRLKNHVGEDIVYRIGGDEFAVFSKKNHEKQIRKIFSAPYYLDKMKLDVKGSIGTSQLKRTRIEPKDLYKLADENMYNDKTNNRLWV